MNWHRGGICLRLFMMARGVKQAIWIEMRVGWGAKRVLTNRVFAEKKQGIRSMPAARSACNHRLPGAVDGWQKLADKVWKKRKLAGGSGGGDSKRRAGNGFPVPELDGRRNWAGRSGLPADRLEDGGREGPYLSRRTAPRKSGAKRFRNPEPGPWSLEQDRAQQRQGGLL